MTIRAVVLAMTSAALVLSGCGTDSEPEAQPTNTAAASTELERARELWAQNGPQSYQMTLVSSCGERSGLGIFEVSVTPQAAEARPVKGTHDESIVTTVEDLYAFIERSAELGAEVVDVSYDSDFGYPVSIEVDHMVDAIDDEACYRVEDFTPTGGID